MDLLEQRFWDIPISHLMSLVKFRANETQYASHSPLKEFCFFLSSFFFSINSSFFLCFSVKERVLNPFQKEYTKEDRNLQAAYYLKE